jgi:hypothetical protein
MNRKSFIALIVLLGWSFTPVPRAAAQDQNGGAPGDWLAHYTSARSLGLGGAFVAAGDEPLGAVWNPAGLSYMYRNQAHFETARLFEGTSINSFSFAMPSRTLPSVGVTILSLSSGDFDRTDELNEPLGTFSEGDLAFLLSAAKAVSPRFSMGMNLKVVRQSVEEFGATGVGADLGLLYDLTPSIRVGASLLNLGGPNLTLREEKETYPGHIRWGAAARVFQGKGLISGELDHNGSRGTGIHLGSEYWLYPSVALRLGYYDTDPSAGMSYRFPTGLQVDYALSDQDLGMTHRIGVSYSFGGFFANSQADPEVFSPLGQQSVTKFHLKSHTKADATNWALEILDKSKNVVRKFGGKGAPPAHVMWDGKSEAGLPLPDGVYHYVLLVDDQEGRSIEGRERWVEITTSGPQGSVPVSVN